ncbi:glycosyltransferase [Aeromicrobium stalagmiti]|uniref:glycosyltransferase n=1 Tax=Aeromicrobium stalagmiti TaxID=2738988 RepID=UPI0034648808
MTLELVIPVHNEETDLPAAVRNLVRTLHSLPWTWRITIADNASTDATPAVARSLAEQYPHVRVATFAEKGRGRALKSVWRESDAQVLAYTDVDLSTDLKALLPLVAPLISGHSDVAIGSRLARGSQVTRGVKRELVSRSYNVLLQSVLDTRFSDAQCGFKAVRREVADALLPWVEDDTWFFDTELLVLAERSGLRIHEVPVDWVDDPDSRVDVMRTALDDLRGMRRLGWALLTGRIPVDDLRRRVGSARDAGRLRAQLALFAFVGVVSSIAYTCLYGYLRHHLAGPTSNVLALVLSTVLNTSLNRRFTFGNSGPGAVRAQAKGLTVLVGGVATTTVALVLLRRASPNAALPTEVLVLSLANLSVTALRFAAMRQWVFRRRDTVGGAT